MLIGQGARKIKDIGSFARKELEVAMNKKVFLDLDVLVDEVRMERLQGSNRGSSLLLQNRRILHPHWTPSPTQLPLPLHELQFHQPVEPIILTPILKSF